MSFEIAHTRRAAPARRRPMALGLSARLLLLTACFVMLAEVLIFVPSAAAFRQSWMEERLEAARLAALAVEAAPNRTVNNRLAGAMLDSAGLNAVAVRRDGVRELVLNAAPPGAAAEFTVDLRELTRAQSILQVFGAFFPEDDTYLRIVGAPGMADAQFIEALAPQAPLGQALRAYSARIIVASIVISLIAAALIYVTLNVFLVRPIRRLTAAITEFADAPDRPSSAPAAPAARHDELGEAQAALAEMQAGLRQTLRQRQRLAELGEAVSRISHDLRAVLSSASLISDRLSADEDPRVREYGARILRSIDRAAALCEAVLRYGAAGEADPKPQAVSLRAALDDAAQDALADRPEGQIAWINRIDPALAAHCDPDHLHRIGLNLFRNAAAAMADAPGRGEMDDASAARPPARLTVEATRRGGNIALTVSDTGPGLSDKARAVLFKPFASAGKGGSGLGLAICRDLASANGGDLRLKRNGPGGAVFELDLPAA